MTQMRCLLIGNESLTLQCGQMLLDQGHQIVAVISRNADVRTWAQAHGLGLRGLKDDLPDQPFDWLFSIANLDIIPKRLLDRAAKGSVNFHDGPLPRYAGLNAPVWAILQGEAQHGITWHLMTGGIDEGDIIGQTLFDIAPDETALSLNTKCYAAAMDSFPDVIAALAGGSPARLAQDLTQRTVFGRDQRPDASLDPAKGADAVLRVIRALDHGDYWNPLSCPRISLGGQVVLVRSGQRGDGSGGAPGTVLAVQPDRITLATATDPVILSGLCTPLGAPFDTASVRAGDLIGSPVPPAKGSTTADLFWRERLLDLRPVTLPFAGQGGGQRQVMVPAGMVQDAVFAGFCAVIAAMAGDATFDLALAADGAGPQQSTWVPLRHQAGDMSAAIAAARQQGTFALDLPARLPGRRPLTMPQVGLSRHGGPVAGTAITLAVTDQGATLIADPAQLGPQALDLICERLQDRLADPDAPTALSAAERKRVLHDWNQTATAYDQTLCIHEQFQMQVSRTPAAIALRMGGQALTYAALNGRANRVAHVLRDMGVGPGALVGLCIRRSADMLIAALAIQKAGGAYVPLDPSYPADRVALYIADSGCQVILTLSDMAATLPDHAAQVLCIDADIRIDQAPETNPESGVGPSDLAYLIFTSGSTGRPKGVMVEHRNVSNFFTGMDGRISYDPPGVWLAVTSLSFDISVLELFWTLARGFTVVMSGDENRALVANTPASSRGMDFSLFYWGNDDGVGRDKYKLLLDGARFADENGFAAVWTPERHFHAFGGPYPNPSVTGAAVAAVTRNLSVRAGSCVAPLHHTARIAEEWAVIDNLTGGKVGLAIASGWQPDDFVLRPENTPPGNKAAMFQAIADLRRLWAGEPVEFPTASGAMFPVVTQPRPVSAKLPVWVTTAGNPETWREAGAIGANVLTHLLGQSVAEVAGKIKIYHQALRDAGHDPADHKVTLMLHTFLAETRDQARDIARGPMKDYLRAAAALIKTYAWAFPAFKKPANATSAMDIDLGSLSPDELEGILDFAFLRYFDESGLFGTVEDAVLRIEALKAIGVDEVACLIDYGIAVPTVLEGLKALARVLSLTNRVDAAVDDSIAGQIIRHKVTHLQCTPSMARMLVTNDQSRQALGHVRHLMIGGEALPGALVADLMAATGAGITNMYGPTETTIWSTTQTATRTTGTIGIGTPIANTQVYVLDDALQPVPIGATGELFIGGEGVARGYWQRDDLTAERFLPNPFAPGRIYRTGDLVRWRPEGALDFLGRADGQVKLRGYRIELGEIEAVLDGLAGNRQSVVMAREDVPGLVQLVAYLLCDRLDEAAARTFCAARLPAHMVPARFVRLDSMPLTPNKKIDRKALGAPLALHLQTAAVAPVAQGSQAAIAAIWMRLLGVTQVGPRDSFFDLGGHSLLAVQAHRDIRDSLGATHLGITDIFRFPTLAALAARVDEGLAKTAVPAALPDDRAAVRDDAMSRRRDMRARRLGGR